MPKPAITLHTPLTEFRGVGPTRAAALAKLGLHTAADLLAYFPRDYEDRTVRESIAVLPPDAPAAVSALRSHVYDIVSCLYHVEIVLDNNYSIASV